jgi:tetratricopeptide (TPR) repeat protein
MKLLFVLSVGLISYCSIEVYISVFDKSSRNLVLCDAWLCPAEFSNARIYDLLQVSASADGGREAVAEFRRALRQDPASAYNWANLAEAEMNSRDPATAKYCFQHAVANAPNNPLILFRAANFAFQVGDTTGTLRLLKSVLGNSQGLNYADAAFLTYRRLDQPIDRVLDLGIPKKSAVASAFLHYWMSEEGQLPAAKETWLWMNRNKLASDNLANDYVSFLIRANLFEEAANAWKQFGATDNPEYRSANWVFNGGFRSEPKISPLDWKLDKGDDFLISRVPNGGRQGKPALRIEFLGQDNVDFHHLSQEIVLTPGRWTFRTWVKTEGVTTNQGISAHIVDSKPGGRLDWTSTGMVETNDWFCLETEFEVGPDTKLVRLEFVRQPSRKFDNKIAGVVWIDSVEVAPSR